MQRIQLLVLALFSFTIVIGCSSKETLENYRLTMNDHDKPLTVIPAPDKEKKYKPEYWFVSSEAEKSVKKRAKKLENKLAEARTVLKERQNRIQTLESQKEQLEQKMAELETDYETSKEKNQSKGEELQKLEEKNESLSEQLENLRSKNKNLTKKLNSTQSELETIKSKLENLESENKNLTEKLNTNQNELKILESKLEKTREKNQKLVPRTKELRSELVEAEEVIDRLNNKLDSLRSENKQLKSRIAELKEENSQLSQSKTNEKLTKIKQNLGDRFEDVSFDSSKNGLLVKFSDEILFGPGQRTLNNSSKQTLDKLSKIIGKHESLVVTVIGHADNTPVGSKYSSNWELSAERAVSVVEYLTDQKELNADKLTASGVSDRRPRASNESESERRLNRRVEFFLQVLPDDTSDLPGTEF